MLVFSTTVQLKTYAYDIPFIKSSPCAPGIKTPLTSHTFCNTGIGIVLEGGQFMSGHHKRWLLHFIGQPEIRQSIIHQLDSLSQKGCAP